MAIHKISKKWTTKSWYKSPEKLINEYLKKRHKRSEKHGQRVFCEI